MSTTEPTLKKVEERFDTGTFVVSSFRDNTRLTCSAERIGELLRFLKLDCSFDMLADITAVDYLQYPDARDRYAVIYTLVATGTGERLIVKVFLNDPDPSLPSAVSLWNGANWLEREVYD